MENFTTDPGLFSKSESYTPIYEKYDILFWAWGSIYLSIALVAVIGNILVLYAALKTRNMGRLRFFDGTIMSLAIADLLIGLIGIPGRITSLYIMGNYYEI